MTPAQTDVGTDEVQEFFHLFNSRRRRLTIRYLGTEHMDADGESAKLSLRHLAESVAADEFDVEPAQLGRRKRKSVKSGLHQNHLPELERYAIVLYDDRAKEAETTERAKQFALLMSAITGALKNSDVDEVRPGGVP